MFRSFGAVALAAWLSAACAPCAGVGVRAELSQVSSLMRRSEDPPAKRLKTGGDPEELEPLSISHAAEISPEDAAALGRVLQNVDAIEAEFTKAMPPVPKATAPGSSPGAKACLGQCEAFLPFTLTALARKRAFFGDLLSGDIEELGQHSSDYNRMLSQKCNLALQSLINFKDCAQKVRDAMKAFTELNDEAEGQRKVLLVERLRTSIFSFFDAEIDVVVGRIREAVSPSSAEDACAWPRRGEDVDVAGIDPLPLGSTGVSDDDAAELRSLFKDPVDLEAGKRSPNRPIKLKKWEAFMDRVLTEDVGDLWKAHVSHGAYGAPRAVDVPVVHPISRNNREAIASQFLGAGKQRNILRLILSLFGSACRLVDDERDYKQQRHSKVLGAMFELLEEVRPTVTAIYRKELGAAGGGS